MTKLLVGYDGSGSAKRTLDQAARTITDGETLAVIIVVPVRPSGSCSGRPFSPDDGPDEYGSEIAEAVEFLTVRGVSPIIITAADDAAEAICETAERDGYTTIVVGRLNDHRLLGSVSSRVVQRAGCDFRIVT